MLTPLYDSRATNITITQMTTLQLTKPRHFEIQKRSIPQIDSGQALVSFKYGLICGSDYPKYAGEWADYSPPLLPGMPIHECVGQVVESKIPNLLQDTWVLAMPEEDCGLADFFVSSIDKIVPLTGWSLSESPFAPLGQPVGAVLHALDRLGGLTKKTVLLVGLGGIGFIFCALLRQSGVEKIIAIEPNAFRRQTAGRLFSIETFADWSDEFTNEMDISIEAVGHLNQSQTLSFCLTATRPYGTIVLFGNPTIPMHTISIQAIVRKNLTIVGAISPEWGKYLYRGVQAVKKHIELFKPLITHQFHWKQAEQAFLLFGQPDAHRIKILLLANQEPITE